MTATVKKSLLLVTVLALPALPALAGHPCTSPLILDLDGDGVRLTGLDFPVAFDIDGDGELNRIGWTYWPTDEAFLWLDLNRNHRVDSGRELFGTATLLPGGEPAANGFEALAVYDSPVYGGNGDGVISELDLIWRDLRLWIDRNHDGVSQPPESRTLEHHKVVALGLEFTERPRLDGGGNLHNFHGAFIKRVRDDRGWRLSSQVMEDVYFVFERDAE